MNIISERDKFLTNIEVLEHLNLTKSQFTTIKRPKKSASAEKHFVHKIQGSVRDLEISAKNTAAYLTKTPAANQTSDAIKQFLAEIQDYELELIEKLQIVNLVPKNLVNLYAIIEECDSRFSEEQCQHILDKLAANFPNEFKTLEEDAEMDVDEGEQSQEPEGDAELGEDETRGLEQDHTELTTELNALLQDKEQESDTED